MPRITDLNMSVMDVVQVMCEGTPEQLQSVGKC